MEIRDLEAFVAVAEELHFGRAAARLHISQPPLSSRIRQLESNLGVDLFVRSTRNVSLTQVGTRLLQSAKETLSQMRLTEHVAASFRSGEQGQVRLGFAGASTQVSLPMLSRAVRNSHPGIELHLQSQTYVYTAIEMLLDGSIDLAFSRLPTHPGLSSRVVEVERIVCALPEDHDLAELEQIPIELLRDLDFVSLPDDQGSILQATMVALCVTAGFRPRVAQIAPDSITVLALVAAGVGVTITLSSVIPAANNGLVYIPLTGIHPSHMFATLTWRSDDPSPALHRVLEVSEQVLPTPDLSDYRMNPFIKDIGRE